MPPWLHLALCVIAALVALLVLVGVWLIWRDRRRLTSAAERLERTNESLSDTAGRFARGVHDLREMFSQMRWGRGPQP